MTSLSALILAGLVVSQVHAAAPDAQQRPAGRQPANPGTDMETLVRELGDESYRVREKATRAIWELGESALPALKDAVTLPDPEQVYRARDLLRKIQLHITPETDPSVASLVERYLKASPSEKLTLLDKMKKKRAWPQMLKLYAAEKQAEIRLRLTSAMSGIAVRAARERILQGDSKEAREFLEMAPADAAGMLALAEFHRSHGTLDAELVRARGVAGRKGAAWRLALERAAGNVGAARKEADTAGEIRISAAMAALAGDPLPWLSEAGQNQDGDEDPIAAAYSKIAAKRWSGGKIGAADLKPLTLELSSRNARQSGAAMNALFLLGEVAAAEPAFVKAEPLSAFAHFESLERIPEALEALGLDADHPDYSSWIAKRMAAIQIDDIEDQHEVSSTSEEILLLANFLERRGLNQEAFDAFAEPIAELSRKDELKFLDFLRRLFGTSDNATGAPMLAKRIGVIWAGDDDRRWEDFIPVAFGDDESTSAWWDWLAEMDPKASRAERLDGMLALYRIGPDATNLREQWLALAWKAVEKAQADTKAALIERIAQLTNQTGDVENSIRAWKEMPEKSRKAVFWGLHIVHLSALERWDEAASVILNQIDAIKGAKLEPGAELYAYAAAALRRAGREDDALVHDAWTDKLFFGNPVTAMRIGGGYAFGNDYKRAGDWWARAAHEANPDSEEFAIALKLHADVLLEQDRWAEAAAVSEVITRIYAASDYRWITPLPFMRQRLQADTARALANLDTRRAESIALLKQCHHDFASDGSLADFFFPSLRKVGLIKEHDRWFQETWDIMQKVIRKYPQSDNTRNTTAWFASRSVLKLDAAAELLTPTLARNPTQAAYLDTMAEIHFAMGDREKALEWSKLAVNFTPLDPQLRRQQDRFRNAPLPSH